jgi:hypothetical protein
MGCGELGWVRVMYRVVSYYAVILAQHCISRQRDSKMIRY